MEIKRAAQAHQFDRGIAKVLLHFGALFFVQIHLDVVGVTGAQFDALKSGLGAVLYDGGEVPVFGDIVGDDAELHFGRTKNEAGWLGRFSSENWQTACGAQC